MINLEEYLIFFSLLRYFNAEIIYFYAGTKSERWVKKYIAAVYNKTTRSQVDKTVRSAYYRWLYNEPVSSNVHFFYKTDSIRASGLKITKN